MPYLLPYRKVEAFTSLIKHTNLKVSEGSKMEEYSYRIYAEGIYVQLVHSNESNGRIIAVLSQLSDPGNAE